MSKVYIIGTGPGDEELITLKAVRVLKECTAVLYDRLVSSNILNYVSDECEIYYCGKEPGAHYKTQEEINDMIVKLAKAGHIVGRVKGGDPYVFGRGGEEILALKKDNIDFEVVPGVTSPIAALNYGGIPITHRGIAQSFHIVTGMTSADEKLNWQALASEKGTLVFMMGLKNLPSIVGKLIANGKDKNTSAAIVMMGTTSKQRKVVGTLTNIEKLAVENNLKSPCIIVVGDVVKFSDEFNWFERKPMFGKNICITRSKEQSSNLKLRLKELGAEVTEINSLKIQKISENLDSHMKNLCQYKHMIFTSVNSVNIFFDKLIDENFDIRNLKAKLYCVGEATSTALKQRGIMPYLVSSEFTAKGLYSEMKNIMEKGDKIFLPCSKIADNFLEESFKNDGVTVVRADIYDTLCGSIRNVNAFTNVDMVLYTSPSTVRNMISMVGLDKIKEKKSIAIGPRTAKALEENGIDCVICSKHSERGFLEQILEF